MRLLIFFFLLAMSPFTYSQSSAHQGPTHNFAVHRLIILNDQGEMLMCREQHVWAPPSFIYKERQYIKEGLDSLAHAYGLQIAAAKLRGQFSYKYDYHPYATLRHYYVANYKSGSLKLPAGLDEAKWMPISAAIEANTVTSIKEITQQIVKYPETVWGGSFMVSHVGDEHPTKLVEPFYPLN